VWLANGKTLMLEIKGGDSPHNVAKPEAEAVGGRSHRKGRRWHLMLGRGLSVGRA
jgi:hypothetical protein